jgi:hypothetical protein
MKRHRFAVLNAALLLMIATSPLLEGARHLARIQYAAMFALILISAVYAVGHRWHAQWIVAPLAVLTGIAHVVAYLDGGMITSILARALAVATILCVIFLLLRLLFSVTSADYETINAALCVYLLMGVTWSALYSMTEMIAPGSFAFPSGAGASTSAEIGSGLSILPIYFSFVTMTTVGYGDILAVGSAARVLAICQAVLGQVYLVVLVARLVGLQISSPRGGAG